MINVVDRVSTYPGRVKLTRADGTIEYVTWERADEPTVPGTPINKALFDSIKADIGLSANITLYVSKSGSDTLGNGTSANPYLTIMKAVASLPKNLNGFDATINIAAGSYGEDVEISRFTGGSVILTGETGAGVAIRSLRVSYGSIVQVQYIVLDVTRSINDNAIAVTNASLICINTVNITGSVVTGLYVNRYGYAMFATLAIKSTSDAAIHATNASTVFIAAVQVTSTTGTGIRSTNGSLVSYNTVALSTATSFNTASGGRIYTGAQASTPNY